MLLEGAIKARLNIVISGGTGSGKTTLLNTLSSFIPNHGPHRHDRGRGRTAAATGSRRAAGNAPAEHRGQGAISATDLVKNALRMRPDRIIIGECRGPETLDMLQAMNTGHDGSLTTLHANTPRDAHRPHGNDDHDVRLRLPVKAMRQQFASAVDLIIQASRLQGGKRRVTHITEVVDGAGYGRHAGDLRICPGGSTSRTSPRSLYLHRNPTEFHDTPGISRDPSARKCLPRTGHVERLGTEPRTRQLPVPQVHLPCHFH